MEHGFEARKASREKADIVFVLLSVQATVGHEVNLILPGRGVSYCIITPQAFREGNARAGNVWNQQAMCSN